MAIIHTVVSGKSSPAFSHAGDIILYYYYYYYYYYILVVSRHRLQVSHCISFRIMCDVSSIAVFSSQSIKMFPGMATRFFLKPFVIIPVAPITTGIFIHFLFYLRCISIHKLLYFSFFPLPFTRHFCPWELPHLSVCMFSLFCF